MVMYPPPPRQSVPPETPHPNPSPVMANAGSKRKRKSEGGRRGADKGSDDDTAASGSDAPRVQTTQQAQTIVDLKKRTKTVCHFFLKFVWFV